ncbi:MAG: hypothetical protein AAGA32_02600, partial [Pseudomonadota bacterium]
MRAQAVGLGGFDGRLLSGVTHGMRGSGTATRQRCGARAGVGRHLEGRGRGLKRLSTASGPMPRTSEPPMPPPATAA